MKKSRIINILLLFVTSCIALSLGEFAFRKMVFGESKSFEFLRNPSIYSPPIEYRGDHFFEEDYWKLIFLFGQQINVTNPHPMLGWTGQFNTETLSHHEHKYLNGKRVVLLYGDSFAMCVDTVKCFQDILNNDPSFSSTHYLLNYGVGGYGVDQIYLLFNETVDSYDKPFVVFSLLTTDMDRSVLKVRDAQKPYFALEEDGLKLRGVPITLTSTEFFEENKPEINSYLWKKFQSSTIYPFNANEQKANDYADNILKINKQILIKAFAKLKALEDNYIVLIFHPVHYKAYNWRLVFLRNLLQKHNIPYICDLDLRVLDESEKDWNYSNYAIEADGHPTSYLNTLVSNELKRYIFDTTFREEVKKRNKNWKGFVPKWEIQTFEKCIKDSPRWLASVDSTARARNIPLDSMIYLSAIWMIQQELND